MVKQRMDGQCAVNPLPLDLIVVTWFALSILCYFVSKQLDIEAISSMYSCPFIGIVTRWILCHAHQGSEQFSQLRENRCLLSLAVHCSASNTIMVDGKAIGFPRVFRCPLAPLLA